jgi:murein DD-endopeptidase MepM/ murein hydrolase activator NlpD
MRFFSHNSRKHAIRAAVLASLAIPTAALAAPGDREAIDDRSATGAEAVAYLSGIAVGTTTEPEDGPFHPVDGAVDYGSAEAGFGNERGRPHEGQDVFAPTGTPVVSPSATEVLETGADGGRGNWAAIYDPARDQTYNYFHMASPAEVEAGEKLAAGEPVGQVGCTGSCYGEHLHFEIREGKDPYGPAVDPLPELQRWEPLGK